MPPGSGLATLIAALVELPFVLVRDLVIRPVLWLNRRRLMRRQLSPAILNRSRAVGASAALTFLIVLAAHLPLLIGHSLGDLLADFLRSGSPAAALAALGAGLALSLLFLIVGLRGARGAPRDPIASVIALALAGGAAFLLHGGQGYVPADFGAAARYGNALLQAVYIAALTAALVYAGLSTPLLGGNARRVIARLIRRRNAPLRPARSGRRRGLALALTACGAAAALALLLILL